MLSVLYVANEVSADAISGWLTDGAVASQPVRLQELSGSSVGGLGPAVVIDGNEWNEKENAPSALSSIEKLRRDLRYAGVIVLLSFFRFDYMKRLEGGNVLVSSGTQFVRLPTDPKDVARRVSMAPPLSADELDLVVRRLNTARAKQLNHSCISVFRVPRMGVNALLGVPNSDEPDTRGVEQVLLDIREWWCDRGVRAAAFVESVSICVRNHLPLNSDGLPSQQLDRVIHALLSCAPENSAELRSRAEELRKFLLTIRDLLKKVEAAGN